MCTFEVCGGQVKNAGGQNGTFKKQPENVIHCGAQKQNGSFLLFSTGNETFCIWLLSLAMGQVLWVDLQVGVKGKGIWIRSVCGEFGEWAKSLDYFSLWLLYNLWILQRKMVTLII